MVSSSWLTKQRKSELVELAGQAGLELDESSTKPELLEALEAHLTANATRLSRNPAFDHFFTARRTPHKARGISDDGDVEVRSVVRGRGRRATKVKSEPEDDESYTAAQPQSAAMVSSPTAPGRRTPTASMLQPRRPSLPASPAVVTNEVEHGNAKFFAGVDDIYTLTGIPEGIDWARETCSSLAAVHATFLFMESYGLSKVVMPWTYLFDIPALQIIGSSSIAVKIPDLFALLSSRFWYPTLLWSATNLFVPLVFAYFYNLTVHTVKRNNARVRVVRYNYDPFTFNVAKFMIVSAVYGTNFLNGYVSGETVAIVEGSQYNGLYGMVTGTWVCGLYALWEATQR